MPGKINEKKVLKTQKRLERAEIVINAMTEEERANPKLITRMVGEIVFKFNFRLYLCKL